MPEPPTNNKNEGHLCRYRLPHPLVSVSGTDCLALKSVGRLAGGANKSYEENDWKHTFVYLKQLVIRKCFEKVQLCT